MSVLKPFKRTFRQHRPGLQAHYGYIKHEQYASAPRQYIRAFEVLQKDLLELFDYVEPADANSGCYSYRIHELHMRACMEVEANCKAILSENGYTKTGDLNMSDYKKLEPTHHLSSYEVRLPIWHGNDNPRRPFEVWKAGDPLPWYDAYNKAKHSRHENFDKSSLRNMLDAMCGLVALLSSQFATIDFGPEGYFADSSSTPGYEIAIGGYFEVKFPDDWQLNEMYAFSSQQWQLSQQHNPNPFQLLTF